MFSETANEKNRKCHLENVAMKGSGFAFYFPPFVFCQIRPVFIDLDAEAQKVECLFERKVLYTSSFVTS